MNLFVSIKKYRITAVRMEPAGFWKSFILRRKFKINIAKKYKSCRPVQNHAKKWGFVQKVKKTYAIFIGDFKKSNIFF